MISLRLLAVAAAGTAIAALGLAAPANAASPAAEGSWVITGVPGCDVYEQIELQGSPAHDYMRWETPGNSEGCYAEITRNGTSIEGRTINTVGEDNSDWYYDGPGDTDQVCVTSGGSIPTRNCGPAN